jgi:hypothetical protein
VECCGFVEFRHELGGGNKKVEICKKFITKCGVFLSSRDFPSLMDKATMRDERHQIMQVMAMLITGW